MGDAAWESEHRRKPPEDSRIEKWKRWLKQIQKEVLAMHAHREVYRTVRDIVNDHGSLPPSHFIDYLTDWYASTQAAAVRRQADRDPRVISLGRLLTEVRDDAARLTRDWYVAHYVDLDEKYGHQLWDAKFGGSVGDHLDPQVVATDLDALTSTAERVSRYMDKHVAHTDKTTLKEPLTFAELHETIDGIAEVFQRYTLLLTASSWATLVPVPQSDWLAIFRVPWIEPEGNTRATRPAETGRDADATAGADSPE